MGTPAENYRTAYMRYQEIMDSIPFRSHEDKITLSLAIGKMLTAAYDFGAAEKESSWKPTPIDRSS